MRNSLTCIKVIAYIGRKVVSVVLKVEEWEGKGKRRRKQKV